MCYSELPGDGRGWIGSWLESNNLFSKWSHHLPNIYQFISQIQNTVDTEVFYLLRRVKQIHIIMLKWLGSCSILFGFHRYIRHKILSLSKLTSPSPKAKILSPSPCPALNHLRVKPQVKNSGLSLESHGPPTI